MLVPRAKIQLRQDEDGIWIAKSDLLPGCHASGQSEAEAVLAFEDAARAHLEALLDYGKPIPEYFRDKFVLKAG
jgi:predicted RNase H-like HicB family nuclease